jgi:putative ABC transport system permease protein
MRRFLSRLVNLVRPARAEREMRREMASHLGLLQEDFERRGLSPEEARLAARRAYGGLEQARELHREARSFVLPEQLLKDLRHGARSLARTPGFTLVAVVTLALGMGATASVFSVVNAVLLRPLPYQDPDRLVTLLNHGTGPVAPANYLDWKAASRSFESMAAAEYWSPNLTQNDPPEHLIGLRMTGSLLPMLGVRPLLGRFLASPGDAEGAPREVVLSHRLWQRRFGSDPAVLGRRIILDGEGYTVVGVMPSAFRFAPFWATRAELWVPLAFGARVHDREGSSLRVFARLGPGVTIEQARGEMGAITARLERQFPGTNRDIVVRRLRENVVGRVERPLLLLLGAVGFVLLIACANVTHMLLARTAERQKEVAVRTALGAGRSRVIRQFLIENLLLASFGTAGGLVLATWGTSALVALSPASLPRVDRIAVDSRVVAFAVAASLILAVLFGLVPALHAATANVSGALKEGGRGSTDGTRRHRLRAVLVASEFALAFMLLTAAGLTIRSYSSLRSLDPGFDPRGVLSMVVSIAGAPEAEPSRRLQCYRQLLDEVRALPGVEAVGAINHLPLAGDLWSQDITIEGRPVPRPGERLSAVYRIVMPGYLETMRLPVIRGRAIAATDDDRAPGVAVVNERAAREYFGGEDAIGQRITVGDDRTWLTVVGVVKDAKQGDWAAEPSPEVYLSGLQASSFLHGASRSAYITLVIRTAGQPADLAPAVKRVVWSLNRNLPVSEVLTLDNVVAIATAQPRFEMVLLGVFAGVALVLAAVGVYGLVNYSVARRTHEIGIRMSLGATRVEVLKMVVGQAMVQVLAGTAAGVVGAWPLGRLMSRLLFGVQPSDPLTFLVVAVVLGFTALLASGVPARRAARIEPIVALRNE